MMANRAWYRPPILRYVIIRSSYSDFKIILEECASGEGPLEPTE